jgi:hypothetical protein
LPFWRSFTSWKLNKSRVRREVLQKAVTQRDAATGAAVTKMVMRIATEKRVYETRTEVDETTHQRDNTSR